MKLRINACAFPSYLALGSIIAQCGIGVHQGEGDATGRYPWKHINLFIYRLLNVLDIFIIASI
jgi:hypothetical protein